MDNITAYGSNQIIEARQNMAELYGRFIAYIDATPKTIDTYRKSLKQMFNYFNLNGITQPKEKIYYHIGNTLKQRDISPQQHRDISQQQGFSFNGQPRKGYIPI